MSNNGSEKTIDHKLEMLRFTESLKDLISDDLNGETFSDDNVERMKRFHAKRLELYPRKNRDYRASFDMGLILLESMGYPAELAILIRVMDKLLRAVSLGEKGEENREVTDEKLIDTILDGANYLDMFACFLERKQERRQALEKLYEIGIAQGLALVDFERELDIAMGKAVSPRITKF